MMHTRFTAVTMILLAVATGPAAAADVKSRLQDDWREDIAKAPASAEGCYSVEYPSKTWQRVGCVTAPARPAGLRHPAVKVGPDIVGNSIDYTAVGHGTVISATGWFPAVKGLKSELDGQANIYSLQLNSNFFTTSACSGASNPGQCQGWQQFLYSSGEKMA